jgi:hypothetical protein
MKSYYRVMLGRKSAHAPECFAGGFIGTDFGINEDLTGKLPDSWREFNQRYIPIYLRNRPDKSKIAAGLIKRCAASSSPSKTTNASAALSASRRTSNSSATK